MCRMCRTIIQPRMRIGHASNRAPKPTGSGHEGRREGDREGEGWGDGENDAEVRRTALSGGPGPGGAV
ncbi:hypothetical protein GA0115259_100404 [Streptomyces sp. MnatMP-M17]|nr:hypothetical protein GA0115259_100404 [Streptomyces sp. MnatMP-M17]